MQTRKSGFKGLTNFEKNLAYKHGAEYLVFSDGKPVNTDFHGKEI